MIIQWSFSLKTTLIIRQKQSWKRYSPRSEVHIFRTWRKRHQKSGLWEKSGLSSVVFERRVVCHQWSLREEWSVISGLSSGVALLYNLHEAVSMEALFLLFFQITVGRTIYQHNKQCISVFYTGRVLLMDTSRKIMGTPCFMDDPQAHESVAKQGLFIAEYTEVKSR